MTPKQWKRTFARIALWGGIIFASVLLFLLAQSVWHVYGKEREARLAHVDVQDTLNDLTKRKQTLSTELSALNTPRGMEAEVRERYPLVKSGEEIIVLTDSPQTASSTPSEAPQSLWERVLSWFSWL